ncbi:MAG: hypothetical protein ACOCV8_02065 [Spirochaetota bacterium]
MKKILLILLSIPLIIGGTIYAIYFYSAKHTILTNFIKDVYTTECKFLLEDIYHPVNDNLFRLTIKNDMTPIFNQTIGNKIEINFNNQKYYGQYPGTFGMFYKGNIYFELITEKNNKRILTNYHNFMIDKKDQVLFYDYITGDIAYINDKGIFLNEKNIINIQKNQKLCKIKSEEGYLDYSDYTYGFRDRALFKFNNKDKTDIFFVIDTIEQLKDVGQKKTKSTVNFDFIKENFNTLNLINYKKFKLIAISKNYILYSYFDTENKNYNYYIGDEKILTTNDEYHVYVEKNYITFHDESNFELYIYKVKDDKIVKKSRMEFKHYLSYTRQVNDNLYGLYSHGIDPFTKVYLFDQNINDYFMINPERLINIDLPYKGIILKRKSALLCPKYMHLYFNGRPLRKYTYIRNFMKNTEEGEYLAYVGENQFSYYNKEDMAKDYKRSFYLNINNHRIEQPWDNISDNIVYLEDEKKFMALAVKNKTVYKVKFWIDEMME